MKRAILHIGTHKTGTSALQSFLRDNAAELDKQGIHYHEMRVGYAGAKKARNGHFLYRYARAIAAPHFDTEELAEKTAVNVQNFLEDLQDHDTMLLSDERLWYEGAIHRKSWSIIKDFLTENGFEQIDAIVYLRRQDAFIASLWNQYVKTATRRTDTLAEFIDTPAAQKIMDYDKMLGRMEEQFGKEHITVRVYDREKLEGGDIRLDFCKCVGIELTDEFVLREREANPSLNINVTEIKRFANSSTTYQESDEYLHEVALRTTLASAEQAMPVVSPELYERLTERYGEGNARVARDYLHDEAGALFKPGAPVEQVVDIHSEEFLADLVRFFTEAITIEHDARKEQQAQAKSLEKHVQSLEKQAQSLEKQVKSLGKNLEKATREAEELKRQNASLKATLEKALAEQEEARKRDLARIQKLERRCNGFEDSLSVVSRGRRKLKREYRKKKS